MISERDDSDDLDALPPLSDDYIAPAPRVSVQAFCGTTTTADAVLAYKQGRRIINLSYQTEADNVALLREHFARVGY